MCLNLTAQTDSLETKEFAAIEFVNRTFDFGKFVDGEKKQTEFEFTNTSETDLFITEVRSHCSCIHLDWPKLPIKPGETGKIVVEFNSTNKGKEKGALQSKRIVVSSNTDPVITYLLVKAIVFMNEDH